MAGMTRLRLTTSRRPNYRRGGLVIGNAAAPTLVEKGALSLDQAFAVITDPNVAVAIEEEDGSFATLGKDKRDAIADGIVAELELTQDKGPESLKEPEPPQAPEPPKEPVPAPAPKKRTRKSPAAPKPGPGGKAAARDSGG